MTAPSLKWTRRFINSQDWRFSRTMPQWPHWYIIRGEGNRREDFDRLATLIKREGAGDTWGRQTRRYLRIGKHKYWVLGDIINRAAPIPSAEVRRRGQLWLRQHGKRVGPYGNLISVRTTRRVYSELRDIVERRGGSMIYERAGYRWGAWVIRLGRKHATIPATGRRLFPKLDRLYEPTRPQPKTWDDYDGPLVPGAEKKLLLLLR